MQTISRWFRIVLALAALALAGRLAAGQPRQSAFRPNAPTPPSAAAAEINLPPDLRLVPADALGFISVHPAAVFEKMLNKDARKFKEFGKALEEQTGLKMTDIERLTIVFFGDNKAAAVIQMSNKDFDEAAVLEALVPDAKKKRVEGKVCYTNASEKRLVYSANGTLVIGSAEEPAVAACLKALDDQPDFSQPLMKALAEAPQHLAVGCFDMRLATALATDNGPCGKQAVASLVGEAEWAVVKCDYDGEIKVDARFTFPTEESAWQGTKMVRMGVDGMRMLCLQLSLASEIAQGDDAKELRRFKSALPLVRQLEKNLQGIEAKPVKCDDGYELAVKFGVKASKEVLTKVLGDALDEKMNWSSGSSGAVSASSLPTNPADPLAGAAVVSAIGDAAKVNEALPPAPTAFTADTDRPAVHEQPIADNSMCFRAVPKNAAAFLTVRVADLFDKMCDKDLEAFKKMDDEFLKNTSLRHEEVELLTVVVLPPKDGQISGPTVSVVALKKACHKEKLFLPLQATPMKKVKIAGKECYQNDAKNRLFYFIDDRTFLWAGPEEEPFAACLKALDEEREEKSPLVAALGRSKDSHVFGWCDMTRFDAEKACKGTPFLMKLGKSKNATMTVHYDGELRLKLRLRFPDEASFAEGCKELKLCLKVVGAEVAMMAGTLRAVEETGESANPEMKAFKGLTGFIDSLENALEGAQVVEEPCDNGRLACLECTVKAGPNVITKSIASVPDLENWMLQLKPSGDRKTTVGPPGVETASWQPVPAGTPAAPPTRFAPPVPEPAQPPQPQPTVKLTVANVTGTRAILYQQDANKLIYCREVPAGEAIDVQAKQGQRWVVIYPDKKDDGEPFVLGNGDGVWLLR